MATQEIVICTGCRRRRFSQDELDGGRCYRCMSMISIETVEIPTKKPRTPKK